MDSLYVKSPRMYMFFKKAALFVTIITFSWFLASLLPTEAWSQNTRAPAPVRQTTSRRQSLMLVPTYSSQANKEDLIANLITQKLFLSLKSDSRVQQDFFVNFTAAEQANKTAAPAIADRYITDNKNAVAVIYVEAAQPSAFAKNGEYEVTVTFFHERNPNQAEREVAFRTTFTKVLAGFDTASIASQSADTQTKSTVITMGGYDFDIREAFVYVTATYDGAGRAPAYVVRVNDTEIAQRSPEKFVLQRRQYNRIEVLQKNSAGEDVLIASFTAGLFYSEYFVSVELLDEAGLEAQKTDAERNGFLDSLVTTDIMAGYSLLAYAQGTQFGQMVSGNARIAISPKFRYLTVGVEMPFIAEVPREKDAPSTTFFGLSPFIGGVFAILPKTELTVHGGAGVFFATQSSFIRTFNIASQQNTIIPQGNLGVTLAYNLPVGEFGFFRFLADATIFYAHYTKPEQEPSDWGYDLLPRIDTPLVFVNFSLGIGLRF